MVQDAGRVEADESRRARQRLAPLSGVQSRPEPLDQLLAVELPATAQAEPVGRTKRPIVLHELPLTLEDLQRRRQHQLRITRHVGRVLTVARHDRRMGDQRVSPRHPQVQVVIS